MSDEHRPDRATGEPPAGLARAVGQGLAAAAGYVVGGPLGAVGGAMLTDATVQVTGRAWDELRSVRQRSPAAMVAMVAHERNTDADDVITEAMTTSENVELLAEAMEAASHTFNERKVAALAHGRRGTGDHRGTSRYGGTAHQGAGRPS